MSWSGGWAETNPVRVKAFFSAVLTTHAFP